MDPRYHLNRFFRPPLRCGELSLIQIGRMHCAADTVIPRHQHLNWFELTIVTEGRGTVLTNDVPTAVSQGDVYLSFPRDLHEIRSDPRHPLKYEFLSFRPESDFFREALEPIMRELSARERTFRDERIAQLVGSALAEVPQTAPYADLLLESILRQIVLYLIRDARSTVPQKRGVGSAEERCYQIMNYIDTHLFSLDDLSEVAAALRYDYSYISALFHTVTGDTIRHYYRARRMETACQLLREGGYPIGEIAELLRYSSIYTFSRAFREMYGLSPSAWRAQRTQSGAAGMGAERAERAGKE